MDKKPKMNISWNTNPNYGPSSEQSLEDKIEQLKWMMQNQPEKFNSKWPFSLPDNNQETGMQQFREMVQNAAFENPVPKHTGEPVYIGPYMVGSELQDPKYLKGGAEYDPRNPEGYGGDQSYIDATDYSVKKGLLSPDIGEYRTENLLGSPDDDYMQLVKSGDMTLEDAIKQLGYVPHMLRGLLSK
jgi:hypothetical protein